METLHAGKTAPGEQSSGPPAWLGMSWFPLSAGMLGAGKWLSLWGKAVDEKVNQEALPIFEDWLAKIISLYSPKMELFSLPLGTALHCKLWKYGRAACISSLCGRDCCTKSQAIFKASRAAKWRTSPWIMAHLIRLGQLWLVTDICFLCFQSRDPIPYRQLEEND